MMLGATMVWNAQILGNDFVVILGWLGDLKCNAVVDWSVLRDVDVLMLCYAIFSRLWVN